MVWMGLGVTLAPLLPVLPPLPLFQLETLLWKHNNDKWKNSHHPKWSSDR